MLCWWRSLSRWLTRALRPACSSRQRLRGLRASLECSDSIVERASRRMKPLLGAASDFLSWKTLLWPNRSRRCHTYASSHLELIVQRQPTGAKYAKLLTACQMASPEPSPHSALIFCSTPISISPCRRSARMHRLWQRGLSQTVRDFLANLIEAISLLTAGNVACLALQFNSI